MTNSDAKRSLVPTITLVGGLLVLALSVAQLIIAGIDAADVRVAYVAGLVIQLVVGTLLTIVGVKNLRR